MVVTPRIRIDRNEWKKTQFWLSSIKSRRKYVGKDVLDAGQNIIYDRTQIHTPRGKSSKLVDGWKKGGRGNSRTVYNEVSYLRPVDEGTKPHVIRPRVPRGPNRKVLKIGSGASKGYWGKVMHPGSKARRFIKKIYDTAKPRVIRLFEEKVDALIS